MDQPGSETLIRVNHNRTTAHMRFPMQGTMVEVQISSTPCRIIGVKIERRSRLAHVEVEELGIGEHREVAIQACSRVILRRVVGRDGVEVRNVLRYVRSSALWVVGHAGQRLFAAKCGLCTNDVENRYR